MKFFQLGTTHVHKHDFWVRRQSRAARVHKCELQIERVNFGSISKFKACIYCTYTNLTLSQSLTQRAWEYTRISVMSCKSRKKSVLKLDTGHKTHPFLFASIMIISFQPSPLIFPCLRHSNLNRRPDARESFFFSKKNCYILGLIALHYCLEQKR